MDDVVKALSNPVFIEQSVVASSPILVFYSLLSFSQKTAGTRLNVLYYFRLQPRSSLISMRFVLGLCGFYAGRRGSLLGGAAVVALCSLGSQHIITQFIQPQLQYHKRPAPTAVASAATNAIPMKVSYLTVFFYSLLSLNLFQTVFPSSVISIGAYAKGKSLPNIFKMAVPTINEAASQKEKLKIQHLGRVFGCHHCGSRQLISQNKFIADHMPPTRQTKALNQVWWRKMFPRLRVQQALWPQCLKCWQMQGPAVVSGSHKLVHHFGLKARHFSLLLALKSVQDENVNSHIHKYIELPINSSINTIRKAFAIR